MAATVRPLPGRIAAMPTGRTRPIEVRRGHADPAPRPVVERAPQTIEPRRLRRMARAMLGARIDLHGLGQDQAYAGLIDFIETSVERGIRGVLVITGKGALGDGVLRRRVPEWLAVPPLRPLIAGISEAHQRHGGGGALYVALKRRQGL